MKSMNRLFKRLPAFVLILLLFSAPLTARQSVDLTKLDAYFSEALTGWNVPGMAIAIVKDGKVVLAKGYGIRKINESGPVDENTLFAIASNTKAFTAAALAMLVDEGVIEWDDRVSQHLPWFQLNDPYVTREMRVRDLLSHRSGLGTYSGDLLWYGTTYSAQEVVKRVRFVPPASTFRSKYGYSNIMFIAAGEIIPAVTGRSWGDFIQERIFNVLNMNNTVASVKDLDRKTNVAQPHGENDGTLISYPWYNWDSMVSAGGIISSVTDMSKWIVLQLNRGVLNDKEIFSKEASRLMWSPHIPIPVSESYEKLYPSTHFRAYGLGWSLADYKGVKIVSHGGGYDGMFSRVSLVPEEDLGIVILTNSMTNIAPALSNSIIDAYLNKENEDWSKILLEQAETNRKSAEAQREKAKNEKITGTQPSFSLDAYSGKYGGEMYGDATVSLENGTLVVRLLPAPDLIGDLSHLHHDTFKLTWRKKFPWFDEGTVQFLMDAKGSVDEMKIDVPNDDFWFYELEFKRKK